MAMMLLRPTDPEAGADEPIVLRDVDSTSEPAAPTLPAWLTDYPDLTARFEPIARALPQVPDAADGRFVGVLVETAAVMAEQYAGLRPRPEPPAPSRPEPEREYAKPIEGRRVVTVRID